jgi:hypothetical protein
MSKNDSVEAMKLALEALKVDAYVYNGEKSWVAIKALEEALAQSRSDVKQEQSVNVGEPVAVWELQESGWETICDGDWLMTLPMGTRLYTTLQQRTWVGLTDEELLEIMRVNYARTIPLIAAVEAKLKEKNT